MKRSLDGYGVIRPRTLTEARAALGGEEPIVPLAGGTALMARIEAGTLAPATLLDLSAVEELRQPIAVNGALTLPALATFRDARHHAEIRRRWPLLATASAAVGALGVQSRATWAGNVAHASPAAAGVPALMAYDTEVELAGPQGSRRVPLAQFYRGYKQTALKPCELIAALHVSPPPEGRREYYRKVAARRFQAIAKTLMAGWLLMEGKRVTDLRLVFGAVAPFTLRATATEQVLRGEELDERRIAIAVKAMQDEIKPIDDLRSTAHYRRVVSGNLLREFLGKNIIL